jgi:pilus assembly protein CpaF
VGTGTAPPEMMQFLETAVRARISFLISGGTGAGKTTLLNALSAHIPRGERLISIEVSAELMLDHIHVVRLETRDANVEGAGMVTQRELVRNSLRMRPDRILVGEVRGAEALDMLQAMNTGHEGSLTTIHANDTRDALARLEMMVAMTGLELPILVVRQYIAAGIRLVVHLTRLQGGARKITRISEVIGMEGGTYRLEDIFGYRQTGVDADGNAVGEFYATGYRPVCVERLKTTGELISDAWFTQRVIADDSADAGRLPEYRLSIGESPHES